MTETTLRRARILLLALTVVLAVVAFFYGYSR